MEKNWKITRLQREKSVNLGMIEEAIYETLLVFTIRSHIIAACNLFPFLLLFPFPLLFSGLMRAFIVISVIESLLSSAAGVLLSNSQQSITHRIYLPQQPSPFLYAPENNVSDWNP